MLEDYLMTDYDDDDYDDEDDLDLSTLPDDELVEQMHDDLYNGLKKKLPKALKFFSTVDGMPTRY